MQTGSCYLPEMTETKEKKSEPIEMTVPAEKLEAMKAYAVKLRKKFPHMKPDRIKKKVAEYFKVKLV